MTEHPLSTRREFLGSTAVLAGGAGIRRGLLVIGHPANEKPGMSCLDYSSLPADRFTGPPSLGIPRAVDAERERRVEAIVVGLPDARPPLREA